MSYRYYETMSEKYIKEKKPTAIKSHHEKNKKQ